MDSMATEMQAMASEMKIPEEKEKESEMITQQTNGFIRDVIAKVSMLGLSGSPRKKDALPSPQLRKNDDPSTISASGNGSDEDRTKKESSHRARSASLNQEDSRHAAVLWLSKARENFKYFFISKETEEAFAEIGVLFDKFFSDFPYNKVDLMFGLMIVGDYYQNAPILSASRVDDLEFVETVRYYMKFACCCYGWKFLYGVLNKKTQKFLSSMVGDAANVKALLDYTQIEAKDIVLSKWTSSLYVS